MKINENEIEQICLQTAGKLWTAAGEDVPGRETGLILSWDNEGRLKAGREELLCSFSDTVKDRYLYSLNSQAVEMFKASGKKSASFGLSLYAEGEEEKLSRILNVEFGAGDCDKKELYGRMEKLVRKGERGLYIHILDNVDPEILTEEKRQRGLLVKFREAFKSRALKGALADSGEEMISLCILSPDPAFCLIQHVSKDKLVKFKDNQFQLRCKVDKKGVFSFSRLGNWKQLAARRF